MEVLLDTSFIISCIRKRIDFLTQLEEQGFRVIVPREVFEEMKDVRRKSSSSQIDRIAIDTALEIFEHQKIKKIGLGTKNVDEGLIEKGKQGYYIATLDRAIKHSVPKKIVIFDARKSVGVG
ncbi:MAG: hypothetical protein IIA87_05760 [Nanoarchaeota archaeon]|nr:hypothetical protein [Nanoarchaeota archaeon]